MQVIGLNALDLLLLFIMLMGIVVGVLRGMLPQLFSLASIWLGLVITLWLYKPFSIYILQGLGIPSVGSDTMSFLMLLFIFFKFHVPILFLRVANHGDRAYVSLITFFGLPIRSHVRRS